MRVSFRRFSKAAEGLPEITANMLRIINFKTEYRSNPLGIDNKKPRFSWQFSENAEIESYRITVYGDEKSVKENNPDVWDSEWLPFKDVFEIEYNGAPLKSHSRYFVTAEVKDKAGKIYSGDVETFETALFDIEDWKGKWVAIPVNFNGGTLLFRKKITLPTDKKIKRARAYICGIGYHEFFLNGKKIGDEVLNPSVTEYAERVEYCVYPMDDLLPGDNVVGAELGYGWFGARKLNAQFYVEFEDGTYFEDHSGPGNGWWVGGSPTIENGIYSGEVYDARIEGKYPLNWATLDYEPTWANGWMYTIVTAAPKGKLEVQSINPIKVMRTFPEKSRTDMGGNVFVSDMGVNFAGWVRIKVKGERGAAVTLKFGEQLDGKGYVNQLNLRSARCSDKYILKGEGVEEYAPRFTYHGFRFVQCEIEGNAELIEITGEHVHSSCETVGSFACSDETLNRLHEIAVLTEQNNEHSILTDCPQRDERFGWLNDLGSRVYQTIYNIDMSRFFPKFTRDITHSQTAKGEIADTVPFYTGGVPADPVCVIYLLMATYCYRYYGDKSVCENEYEHLKAWVEYLKSRSADYIMDYYYYGDWVLPYPDKVQPDNIFVSTTYLHWHLKEMKKIAEIVGNKEDIKLYEKDIELSRKAINAKYFDEKTCNYSRGTQSENAIALSLGICEEKYVEKVAKNIHTDVVERNYHCTSGNVGYRHVFYMLAKYGYAEDVIKILTNPEYPGWGYMIANGATSVWERWEYGMTNEMHSFNHPMFGSYDAFLYKFLGGIDVDETAFGANKILIEPIFVKDVDYVKTSYKTVRGLVKSEWKRNGKEIEVHLEVPPFTVASFISNSGKKEFSAGEYNFKIAE